MANRIQESSRPEIIRIVAVYAIFGGLWIYLSDTFLGLAISDPAVISRLSLYKGLVFIALTATLLYFLIARYINRISVHLTERKKAEEAIIKSNDKFMRLADNISGHIAYVNANTLQYEFVNAMFVKSFGIPRERIIGSHIKDVIGEANYQFALKYINEVRSGKAISYENTFDLATGKRWIQVNYAPVINTNGCVESIAVLSNDITERRQAEEEKAKLENQLSQAQKMESIGTLAGGIAHDFNNLLQGVFGYISLAKMKAKNPGKCTAALEEAEKALHQSVNLTNQLLTFSKGGKPVKRLIELQSIIEKYAKFTLSGSRSDLRLNIPDCLWHAEVDEGQIGQVIQNIVLNADQAMPVGGSITITASNVTMGDVSLPRGLAQGDYVVISVQDTGIGIPDQYLSKIFDPYFTTKEKGSGLGLATSYSIVRNHGGMIDIRTKSGVGTTLLIYLPAIVGQVRTASEEKQREISPSRKAKILVMDDDEVIRNLSCELLGALGHTVDVAIDGKEALNKYKSAISSGIPFDIVILDLTIKGGMGGVETLQQLLKMNPQIKAVVSSGYSDDAVIANYLSQGFKASLKKPYNVDTLNDVLSTMLKR
jgi:PAS domain S-box-containing protein